MVTGNKSGKMDLSMMVSGQMIKLMDKEHWYMEMEIYMMGNGWMIKRMGLELINMLMGRLILVNGCKIDNMGQELRNGQMDQSTRDNILMDKKTEMVV